MNLCSGVANCSGLVCEEACRPHCPVSSCTADHLIPTILFRHVPVALYVCTSQAPIAMLTPNQTNSICFCSSAYSLWMSRWIVSVLNSLPENPSSDRSIDIVAGRPSPLAQSRKECVPGRLSAAQMPPGREQVFCKGWTFHQKKLLKLPSSVKEFTYHIIHLAGFMTLENDRLCRGLCAMFT